MRSSITRRTLTFSLLIFIFISVFYVSRPHLHRFRPIDRGAKSQTPNGMDASVEKETLDSVAENADMAYPLFDYTYDKIASIASERKRLRDPCSDVLLADGGRKSRAVEATRVLVTGGAGFIGSNLVDRLVELGYKVRIFDNLYTGFLRNVPLGHPEVEFVLGDILNRTALAAAMKDVDFVYHLAAMSKVVPSLKDPDMARFCTEANALGTWNVLNAVKNQGEVKKVVYAASSTYYGNRAPPHKENMAPDFITPYAASKFEGEIQMQMFDRLFGVPTVSTRFFMVYGPRQPSTGAYAIVTGVFAKQAAEGRPLTIEGDGTHFRDFIHVNDIVEGLIIAQQLQELRGEVVNLGSGTSYSVKDVANLVSANQIHIDPRPNDLEGTLASTCKMKRVLSFRAKAEFKTEMAFMAKETMEGNIFSQGWLSPILALSVPHLLPSGTPVFKWPTDTVDIDALLLALKHVEDSTMGDGDPRSARVSVIVYATAGDRNDERQDVLLNTVFSLVRFGQVRQYLVAAVDEEALNTCTALNLPCYDARTQTVPSLLKALTSRGKDVHLARLGNSYISSVHDWYDRLVKNHGPADVFGASPQGDVFVNANDHARAAIRNWTGTDLRLGDQVAIERMYNIALWPPMDITTKPFEVQRWCKNKNSWTGEGITVTMPDPRLSQAYNNEDGDLTPSTAGKAEDDTSSEDRLRSSLAAASSADHHDEPQTMDEAEAQADTMSMLNKDQVLRKREGPGDQPDSAESMAMTCSKGYYRAVGCSKAGALPKAAQLISGLRAAGAWHLTSCSDRKHCDRQQVVPRRWIQPEPDLRPFGGLCT